MEQNRPAPVTANDTQLARTLCSTEKTRKKANCLRVSITMEQNRSAPVNGKSSYPGHGIFLSPMRRSNKKGLPGGSPSAECCCIRCADHMTPCASMASLIFRKLATLAPTTRLPGLPTATEAS